MAKTITVYSTTDCAYCVMVKKWLTSKNLTFSEVNLDEESADVRQKVIEMSGAMTVPVILVEDETGAKNVTIGWNPGKLAAAVA